MDRRDRVAAADDRDAVDVVAAETDVGEAGRPVHVTISIGVATFPDERITDPESFLKLADANLYKAKADGRNRFRD